MVSPRNIDEQATLKGFSRLNLCVDYMYKKQQRIKMRSQLGGEMSIMKGVRREETRDVIIFKLYFKNLDRKVEF